MASAPAIPKAPIESGLEQQSDEILYPDSDGEPMANNTEHYELIASTKYGLERLFHDRDDVFVAADLFWYPVEGNPKIVLAPDVMVAFGRPPGARKSYKQWEEANTPFHVVFEFLSESNTTKELFKQALFFDRYGVEEYYQFDMRNGELVGYVRYGGELSEIEPNLNGWVSPLLGVAFEVVHNGSKPEFFITAKDGGRFATYKELLALGIRLDTIEAELGETKAELTRKNQELQAEKDRAERLAEKLRALGIDTDENM